MRQRRPILPFPSAGALRPTADDEHAVPADGVYRNTVIKLRHFDLLGRPIYVALDGGGCEIDRSVAVSWPATAQLLTRLWEAVDRRREDRPTLLP